ncbi:MAG: hypothetical protein SGI92_00925 [Bryobacteraceae bacterium]|nr:hypothetical protein [Bryobacteraceae bacterium]
MARTPNFERIVATITASDIQKFLHSSAPEDDKRRVREAATDEIRMRFVGGYMIRTNQITAARLNPPAVKVKAASTKAPRVTKPRKAAAKSVAATSTESDVASPEISVVADAVEAS